MSTGKFALFLGSAIALAAITHRFPAHAQQAAPAPAADSGVIRIKSAYGIDDTLVRIKKDIAAKGLRFFDEIDQAQLAAGAGIKLQPSVLLMFGNPPLGIQFLTANPYAGLDWPVRMLVFEDATGQVWIAYSDFAFIANRHHISDRSAQFKMASEVAASIASSAQSEQMSQLPKP
jgi:uncharacterized protein (DUF302 family)